MLAVKRVVIEKGIKRLLYKEFQPIIGLLLQDFRKLAIVFLEARRGDEAHTLGMQICNKRVD